MKNVEHWNKTFIKDQILTHTEMNTLVEKTNEVIDKVNKDSDFFSKNISEYNVSINHPTSGIDGGNKYTLETAIAQVPSEYRTIGIKCSFINEAGKPETWEYVGPEWGAVGFVKLGAGVIGDINSILDNINGEVI